MLISKHFDIKVENLDNIELTKVQACVVPTDKFHEPRVIYKTKMKLKNLKKHGTLWTNLI